MVEDIRRSRRDLTGSSVAPAQVVLLSYPANKRGAYYKE